MTLSGMTGFARTEGARGPVSWAWEVKSVNGRGFDLRVRLPSGLDALEPAVREAVQKRFRRGSVTANLQLQRESGGSAPKVNRAQLAAVIDAIRPFIAEGVVAPPRLDGLLALRGVLEIEDRSDPEEEERLRADLLKSFSAALEALTVSRRAEGAALAAVLADAVDRIERLRDVAAAHAATQPETIRERLRERIAELIGDAFPEDRLAVEAAALAVKADVREELDRLAAHVVSARELLASPEPAGRRLDFLSQEFNREANTLCSKSADAELTRIGLDLKAAIEQFREQAQNVE
jgi:uncharacterized protein (TIGR00255 family)